MKTCRVLRRSPSPQGNRVRNGGNQCPVLRHRHASSRRIIEEAVPRSGARFQKKHMVSRRLDNLTSRGIVGFPAAECPTFRRPSTAIYSSRCSVPGTDGCDDNHRREIRPRANRHGEEMGADHPVIEILRITDGRAVDVAIKAFGRPETFEAALRVLRPGGTLSSLGVYSNDPRVPLGAFAAGLDDHKIITTLCPGGKERMRRRMDVVATGRIDTRPLVTHRFRLDEIDAADDRFANQHDDVMNVAISP